MMETQLESIFVTPEQLCASLQIAEKTLRTYKSKEFKEGVHYIKLSQTLIRYNYPMVLHWLQTRHNPAIHDAAITDYLESLKRSPMPTNQAKRHAKSSRK